MYRGPMARADVDGDAAAKRLRALTRIRKLLRLAEDQSDRPEGRVAQIRADALMTTYGFSRHQVHLEGADHVDFRHRAFTVGAQEAWRRTLVHAVADYFDCAALYKKDSNDVETYGPEHILPQVEYTFTVYLRQLRDGWRAHARDLQDDGLWASLNRRQHLELREGFCVSFVLGVKERLLQDRQEEADEDPCGFEATQRQRKELERFMRRAGLRWRSALNRPGAYSAEGWRAGFEADVRSPLKARGGPRQISG